ncbi:MAG: hypothetical protein ABWX85_07290 [Arthrobacter sp.]
MRVDGAVTAAVRQFHRHAADDDVRFCRIVRAGRGGLRLESGL